MSTTLGLDLQAGCNIALDEMYGDWYRDPWAWVEFQWLSGNASKFDLKDLLKKADGEYSLAVPPGFHLTEVPKNRLGVRPAVIQDPLTRVLYATAVGSNLTKLHESLPDWVYGWRAREGVKNRAAKNRLEWANYLEGIPAKVGSLSGLQIDISSFFASVRAEVLTDTVFQRIGNTAAAGIIQDVLRQHDALVTRSGLPQRSFASAALAHVYLRPVDDALVSALSAGVVWATRWMDDISLMGAEERLYQAYLEIQDRIRQLGLEPNAAKTKLTTAAQLVTDLKHEGLKEVPIPKRVRWESSGAPTTVEDIGALERLEEAVLADPGPHTRTWLRATLTSLVQREMYGSWEKWLQAAKQIPHAADALGRYLRAFAEYAPEDETYEKCWGDLADWFGEYSASPWCSLDWVAAQYALIFPTNRITGPVEEVLTNWLAESSDAQKVAIAAQRLGASRPGDCRDILRARVDRVADPVLLRIMGISLLEAGADRTTVRAILKRDRRNAVVLAMFEDTSWKVPKVSLDFVANRS
ncbi:RNA-directed DNA polymerase [Catelliglobosispora koreensis]|uniref:RNA-directed DNA polymerase n=1 Tax=Catelliglobosispora koreensis TaxID=129052 RepID=UPI0003644F2E|nr:RNA-directed DNA polymerase [Catelliglobosispora koreensis]